MKRMPNGKQVTVEWLIKTGQVITGRTYKEHLGERPQSRVHWHRSLAAKPKTTTQQSE